MKIIVNATPLLNIPTGIGRYIKALYSEISLQHPEIEIKYFDGTALSDVLPVPPEDKGVWTVAVNLAWRLPYFFPYLARIFIHKKREQAFFNLSKGFDIYHEAGFFPFKTAKQVKIVFTVHDISLKTLPDFHPKDRVLFFRKYFEQSLRNIDAVITPSRFTETEIRKTYPEISAEIHPIHLGYDKTLFFKRPETEVNALKAKLKLPEKYILFVGTSDPRKNIKAIIQAMAHLPESVVLVCTGWSGWDSMKGLKQSAADLKKRILFTGYVADQELAALYSGARVFVYPSFYEGFGLPVLEAMACGCPVVCANTASLPEVAGDAAMTCDPNNPVCLADAIYQIFTSDSLYAEMRLKSVGQAQKFTWAEAADKTIRVFAKTPLISSLDP
jgi:alpha-1,3-rhamnosyl/mannosyltransferase